MEPAATAEKPTKRVGQRGQLQHCPAPASWRPSATAFVGRDDDVASLAAATAENRLVTVTGVGGVGKTRLVAEALPRLTERLGLSAAVAELAAAGAADVDAGVARALEVRAPARTPREAVVEYLAGKSLLLVLDNCEHTAAAVREMVDQILRGCPDVRILATSRSPLESPEEQVLPLAPLPAPRTSEGAEYAAAVRLFADRTRRARPSFTLTQERLPAVADICRRLDGLPLAVELAAARAAALGVGPLRDRLGHGLDLLGGGASEARRPRTLRAVIDWSYHLLGEADRRLFAALATFDGGFDLEATERVVAVHGDLDVAAGLARLVEASLVLADDTADAVRYRLLAVIHEYAAEVLAASGQAHALRSAHAAWALSLASAAAGESIGPRDTAAFARIDQETANLRSAVRWALDNGGPDLAAGIAGSLAILSNHRADPELLSLIRRTAEDPTVLASDRAPLALAAGSRAAHIRGDLAEARRLAGRVLATGTSSAEERATACHSLGVVALYRGEHGESASCWSHLLDMDGLPAAYHADAHVGLALLALYRGDVAEARACAARANATADVCGAAAFQAFAAYVEGEIRLVEQPASALDVLGDAADRAAACGATHVTGLAGTALASGLVRLGRHREALARFGPLLEHWHRMGAWPQLWTTIRLLAELLADTGRPQPAALLLAASDRAASAPAVTGTDAERGAELRRRVRESLGGDVHDRILTLARS